ncbi:MAG: MBL fold metallo-hydrolase [Betaproteobacteria bacterium]|nr:MBL fold metallo-hydrolase [Betaproteobacteria bacterium]
MIFRQLFDPQSSTYTYLLADSLTREAVLIDPVFEHARRDAALIGELDLKLLFTLETHVHADHVTGASLLKRRLGSKIALSKDSGAEGADRYLANRDLVAFGMRTLEARATPGHTSGCMSYVLDDRSRAFTGDALLIRGCGRTDFQQGSAPLLYRSVREQLFSLPDDCLLYPGHDYRGLTASSVGEEKKYNPRLALAILEADFTGYMTNLGLAHPKLMDVAVPANLRCGRPEKEDMSKAADTDWAPLAVTFAGIWELQPDWVAENPGRAQLLDVREPAEFTGSLGRIAGAKLIPLGSLTQRSSEIDKDKPVVVVCRSGARSAQATVMLKNAGFNRVANLAGGMLRWRAQHLPVEGGTD